jgi:4'-phosphopantetheinyl transferase
VTSETLLAVVIDARGETLRVSRDMHDVAGVLGRAPSILTPFERERCDRVIPALPRALRTAAHVLKRETLALALGLSPRDVPLREPADRPLLAPPHDALRASLSHTRGAVAIAFGPDPLGVDIERLDRGDDAHTLAERYFAPGEAALLGDDPSGLAFAWRWTAKEALKKAADIDLTVALARPMPPDARESFEAHGARFDVMRPADSFVCTLARMR